MSNFLRIAIVAFLLSGCSLVDSRSLPYDAWRLGFSAPNYMEVWIETADVIDIKGQVYRRAMTASLRYKHLPTTLVTPKTGLKDLAGVRVST